MKDLTTVRWQAAIVRDCERILARKLRPAEKRFITSRDGYVALESIGDHVRGLTGRPDELERYLNSEAADEAPGS